MDIIYYVLNLIFCITRLSIDAEPLVVVSTNSLLTIPELWTLTGVGWNNTYKRSSGRIDRWNQQKPNTVSLSYKDINGRDASNTVFNSADSSDNLIDILASRRIISANPIPSSIQYDVHIQADGSLYLTDHFDNSLAYLIHGRLNKSSSDITSCISIHGTSFHIDTALSKIHNEKVVLMSKVYEDSSGFQTLKVDVSGIAPRIYVNGISVYNQNNTQIQFTLKYGNYENKCVENRIDIVPSNTRFLCDGTVYDLYFIKAICLEVYFTEIVKQVEIKLTEPAEDYTCNGYIRITGNYDTDLSPEITTTTPLPETTTYDVTNTSQACHCPCGITSNTSFDDIQIETIKQKIRKELLVEKSSLSSTLRKKISASDPRVTSQSIGFVGAILIAIVFGLIVSTDILNICVYLQTRLKRILNERN